MHPQIPDFFFRNGVTSGGTRKPKRPKLEAPKVASFLPVSAVTHGKGDALSQGDLRYWVGFRSTNGISNGYAACRACGEVCTDKETRRKHMKDQGCGWLLTEAYKALLRDRKCVVCDLVTTRRVWGVPMCCKDCEAEWSFVTRCPDALRAAKEYVKTWVRK